MQGRKSPTTLNSLPMLHQPLCLSHHYEVEARVFFKSRELFTHDPLLQGSSGKVRRSPQIKAQLTACVACWGVKAGLSWCFDTSTHGWDQENGSFRQGDVLEARDGQRTHVNSLPTAAAVPALVLHPPACSCLASIAAVPRKPYFNHGPETQLLLADPAWAPSLG